MTLDYAGGGAALALVGLLGVVVGLTIHFTGGDGVLIGTVSGLVGAIGLVIIGFAPSEEVEA